jgi:putative drug exporter of the RND superfamily
MTSMLSTMNLARISARRPWRVVSLWLLILVLAGAAATHLQTTMEGTFTSEPESSRAQSLIEQRLNGDTPVMETVIIRSETATVDDAAYRAFVDDTTTRLLAVDGLVTGASTYYQLLDAGLAEAESLVSADRHATLIQVQLGSDLEYASEHAERYLDVIYQQRSGGFDVLTAGMTSSSHELLSIAEEDMRKAELFGLPVALLVLVVVFGTLVAAGVPIIIGIVSIGVAFGLAAVISQVYELDFFITNMISMIGLAVGIDYALFIIERFREERRGGAAKERAIEIAGATASKAVLFSGTTVILALTGMFLIPMTMFKGLAIGAILAVSVAVAAALTLIPALLSLLGDRINWPRRRRASHVSVSGSCARVGFLARTIELVMQRPMIAAVVSVLLLVAISVPVLELETGQTGAEALPDGDTKAAVTILRDHFYVGLLTPVQIVVDGDLTDERVVDATNHLITDLAGRAEYGDVITETSPGDDLMVITTPLASDSNTPESFAAIESLRDDILPDVFAGVAANVLVTGETAIMLDFNDMLSTWMPIVIVFVLGLSFMLLTVVFRSIVVPALSIVMNLLSVGAAYGMLVLAFQRGYGEFLGFAHTPVIEAWIPVFLFCILFGLSMDYHVFLLSRIREHYDRTGHNDESVVVGLQATARIITGAALIMVVVFGAFAAGRMVSLQQVGFGLAVSVFLDATIVRSILVPSAMKMLGDRNWYLPATLRRIPDVRIDEGTVGSPSPASAAD